MSDEYNKRMYDQLVANPPKDEFKPYATAFHAGRKNPFAKPKDMGTLAGPYGSLQRGAFLAGQYHGRLESEKED